MRKFEYNDENINEKQYIVAYGAIGVIILVFQKELALLTVAADGLMLILAGGAHCQFSPLASYKICGQYEKTIIV